MENLLTTKEAAELLGKHYAVPIGDIRAAGRSLSEWVAARSGIDHQTCWSGSKPTPSSQERRRGVSDDPGTERSPRRRICEGSWFSWAGRYQRSLHTL